MISELNSSFYLCYNSHIITFNCCSLIIVINLIFHFVGVESAKNKPIPVTLYTLKNDIRANRSLDELG